MERFFKVRERLEVCVEKGVYLDDNRIIIHQLNMLTAIHPKLPMRDQSITKNYYLKNLSFEVLGDYTDYLIVGKDTIEIHFFMFKELDPKENYGQVYIRTNNVASLYEELLENNVAIHPNGHLATKSWGQREFALLDPDNNLLTFGEAVNL